MNGIVRALWRHPIKGHGREAMETFDLTSGTTIPWDRRWAVAHEAARTDGSDWAPSAHFSRGSKVPALMAINAVSNEAAGTVTLTHPQLDPLTFNPDSDSARFLDWVRPIMPADRAASARIVRVDGRGMTDTPYPSVSLINLASNDDLSDRMGAEISPLRWRCNIHFDGLPAWSEFDWTGRNIRVGSAELTVREPILRCMATTANPATGIRDLDTLGALKTNWNHQDFGIYAEVTRSGRVAIGDIVQAL